MHHIQTYVCIMISEEFSPISISAFTLADSSWILQWIIIDLYVCRSLRWGVFSNMLT